MSELWIDQHTTEAEIRRKAEEAIDVIYRRHRDAIIFEAEGIASSWKPLPDIFVHHVFPEPIPTPDEWREQWKKEAPRKIEDKLLDIRNLLKDLKDVPQNFSAWALKNAPCNWNVYFVTLEEYVQDLKKTRAKDFETVNEAMKCVEELLRATEEALSERQVELKAHECEIPALVKECTASVEKLNRLHAKILKDKRGAEVTTLSEKELGKIVQRLQQYEGLSSSFNAAFAELAQITPHRPELALNLPRPLRLPMMPGQIEKAKRR